MSFCGNCGTQNTDESIFCQSCGAPLTPATPVQPGTNPGPFPTSGPIPGPVPPSNGGLSSFLKSKTFIGIAACAVVLIIIICVALNVKTGPEKALNNVAKTLNHKPSKVSDLKALFMNDYSFDVTKDLAEVMFDDNYYDNNTDYDSFEEAVSENFEDALDKIEDEVGDNWKVTCDVKKVKYYDKTDDEFEEAEDAWDNYVDSLDDSADYFDDNDYYDYYEGYAKVYKKYAKKYKDYKVTKVCDVKVKMSIKGEDDNDSDTSELRFAKVNGKWICISGNGYSSMVW